MEWSGVEWRSFLLKREDDRREGIGEGVSRVEVYERWQ